MESHAFSCAIATALSVLSDLAGPFSGVVRSARRTRYGLTGRYGSWSAQSCCPSDGYADL